MASGSRRLGSFLLAATAVGSLGFVRCYPATEILVDLRTDLACATFQPKTQIRMGEEEIVAETGACEPSSAEEQTIGTLVFVPSADRDARVVVEVVLAVKGLPPEECRAHPERCIVARRAFSFIEHSSRRLPVVLRDQCLGKVCSGGETCVKGGACVAIDDACRIERCFAESPPADPPPGTPDSGTSGCASGEIRCAGARLEECTDGAFVLRDLCDTPDLCMQRSGSSCAKAAAGTCTGGEKKCAGASVLQCRGDGTGFDTLVVCSGACTAVGGPARCVACAPGERRCDTACEISGPSNGTTADDCLVKCNADGTAFVFEQNCGIAQHGTFSDSCRTAPAKGGAECF